MKLANLKTEFLGKNVIYFDEIDSTQLYAKSQSEENLPNGTVIIANAQLGGVGTHDRKWYTGKDKNIAMTLVVYPQCSMKKLTNITTLIAETLIQTIQKLYGYTLEMKIPNDIVYHSKKIGGILTESITEGETVKKILIGIGLNVNQTVFPGTLKDMATSLKKEFHQDFDRLEMIKNFLEMFEKQYNLLIKS